MSSGNVHEFSGRGVSAGAFSATPFARAAANRAELQRRQQQELFQNQMAERRLQMDDAASQEEMKERRHKMELATKAMKAEEESKKRLDAAARKAGFRDYQDFEVGSKGKPPPISDLERQLKEAQLTREQALTGEIGKVTAYQRESLDLQRAQEERLAKPPQTELEKLQYQALQWDLHLKKNPQAYQFIKQAQAQLQLENEARDRKGQDPLDGPEALKFLFDVMDEFARTGQPPGQTSGPPALERPARVDTSVVPEDPSDPLPDNLLIKQPRSSQQIAKDERKSGRHITGSKVRAIREKEVAEFHVSEQQRLFRAAGVNAEKKLKSMFGDVTALDQEDMREAIRTVSSTGSLDEARAYLSMVMRERPKMEEALKDGGVDEKQITELLNRLRAEASKRANVLAGGRIDELSVLETGGR